MELTSIDSFGQYPHSTFREGYLVNLHLKLLPTLIPGLLSEGLCQEQDLKVCAEECYLDPRDV